MKRFYYLLSMLALIVAGMLCLTSCGDDELDCIEVESYRRAVDLGLPSRTLWANMNVGASENTAFGAYFACGETAPKKNMIGILTNTKMDKAEVWLLPSTAAIAALAIMVSQTTRPNSTLTMMPHT